jgi:hypothetical protein
LTFKSIVATAFMVALPAFGLWIARADNHHTCVAAVVAAASGDVPSIPSLSCHPFDFLAVYTPSASNQTTSPKTVQTGFKQLPIVGEGGIAAFAGAIPANSKNVVHQNEGKLSLYAPAARTFAEVETNDALAHLSVFNGGRVRRLGFHQAGDGGAADYYGVPFQCPLNSGAGDNGSQVAAPGGCWIVTSSSQGLDLRVFGAYGDYGGDNHDDTAAISNWLAYSASHPVTCGPGHYLFTSALVGPSKVAASIICAGSNLSVFVYGGTNSNIDLVTFGSTSINTIGCSECPALLR